MGATFGGKHFAAFELMSQDQLLPGADSALVGFGRVGGRGRLK